ncbi:MAG: hypothetical protein P4L83_21100 [Nevskia sp.]|nr:hypothetical protein [Nevskia sp.]
MTRAPVQIAAVRAARAGAKAVGELAEHPDTPEAENGLPPGCPVLPLGKFGEFRFYLDADKQLVALPAEKHGRLNLLGLFGAHRTLPYEYWPRMDKDGATVGWRPELAAEEMMAACSRKGIWDPAERERGRGAWRGPHGELILHVGNQVQIYPAGPDPWTHRQILAPGVLDRYVYPAGETAGLAADVPGMEPAQTVLDALGSWEWRRGELDAVLLLGWIGAAMIGGALDWRPVVWVTGSKGTGKSTLQERLRLLFDDTLVQLADTSEAYVRQRLRHQTLPVLVDELEAEEDNRRAMGVVKLARIAASGGRIGRGGADHQGVEFTLRSAFMFSSILVPPLLGQDRSRIAILDLKELTAGAQMPLVADETWRQLGAQLRRRMVDGWPRWRTTLEWYRGRLQQGGHTARGADQFGTLLAAADLLLYSNAPERDMDGWVDKLSARTTAEVEEDVSDQDRCLQHLLTQSVDPYRNGGRKSVAEWVRQAAGKTVGADVREANGALGTYGLHVDLKLKVLVVADYHQGLAALYAQSQWQSRSGAVGVWVQALRRLPGAERARKVYWFAGAVGRGTALPLDVVVPDMPFDME